MRAHVSPGPGRRYPLTLICQVFRVPRSSLYVAQTPSGPAGAPGKRGPKTRWADAELVAGIRLDAEGRSASRIALDEGGRYLSIPRNAPLSRLTSVQGTGCGTEETRRNHPKAAGPRPI